MQEELDAIDLTTSPDDLPRPQVGDKRRRSEGEAIDLVSEDEDEAEAAAARQRIMAFARRVNLERGICGSTSLKAGGRAAASAPTEPELLGTNGAHAAGAGSRGPTSAVATAAGVQAQQQQQQQPAAATSPSLPSTNSLLAQLHAERMARQAQRQAAAGAGAAAAPALDARRLPQQAEQQQRQAGQQQQPQRQGSYQHRHQPPPPPPPQQQQQQASKLSLLTYNVWFREDLHVEARMAAIGDIIAAKRPNFVCLQEVTPRIYQLFAGSAWWASYHASPCPPGAPYFTVLMWRHDSVHSTGGCASLPYENSIMGRDLKTVGGSVGGWPVRVATTHLESPTGWDQLYSQQRVAQCKQAAAVLDQAPEPDVLFAGDMNWGPDDGVPPLPGGWSDAWNHLHSGDPGLTYDPKANPMLKKGNRIRRRLDRVFVRLRRWRLHAMEMVGREPLPGLSFEGRPVLPSDHFGLFLELRPAEQAAP